MNAVTQTVAAEPVSDVEIFVPLAKLKKSPRNARKVPHGEAAIEALAASIQHKRLIQNEAGLGRPIAVGGTMLSADEHLLLGLLDGSRRRRGGLRLRRHP